MGGKVKIDIARKPVTFTACHERHSIFAPSWELLRAGKMGGISWQEYTERYYAEMREAYQGNPDAFRAMARRLDQVEFICWCNAKAKGGRTRCHRFLLRQILEKVRAQITAPSSTSTAGSDAA